MKRVAIIGALFLAACSPEPQIRELSNVSVNALMAQPVPQFFATLRVAGQVAQSCPTVTYDAQTAEALIAARTRDVGGPSVELRNVMAIDLETDVSWRSLQARYPQKSACEVAASEIASQTAASAVLVVK